MRFVARARASCAASSTCGQLVVAAAAHRRPRVSDGACSLSLRVRARARSPTQIHLPTRTPVRCRRLPLAATGTRHIRHLSARAASFRCCCCCCRPTETSATETSGHCVAAARLGTRTRRAHMCFTTFANNMHAEQLLSSIDSSAARRRCQCSSDAAAAAAAARHRWARSPVRTAGLAVHLLCYERDRCKCKFKHLPLARANVSRPRIIAHCAAPRQ